MLFIWIIVFFFCVSFLSYYSLNSTREFQISYYFLEVRHFGVLFRRAFHHYRSLRDQKEPVKKHLELERLLREEYRSLDDFRAKERSTTASSRWQVFPGRIKTIAQFWTSLWTQSSSFCLASVPRENCGFVHC